MDLSKLSMGQKITAGATIVLIVALFLPWYGAGVAGFSVTISAFDAGFLAWGGSLIAIAGGVVVALKALEFHDLEAGNLKAEQIGLVLAGLGTILILLRLITESSFTKFGIFVALLAGIAATYGAFQSMREVGLAMPGADDFKSLGGPSDSSAEPTDPPEPSPGA